MDLSGSKPLPTLEGLTGQWYEFLRQHELRFQRCNDCGEWRHPPREFCGDCGSGTSAWVLSSGRGSVFSWTTVVTPLHPAFAEDAPYSAVVVELDEGPRIMSWVTDCPPGELGFNQRVSVWFDDVSADVTLPKFQSSNRRNPNM